MEKRKKKEGNKRKNDRKEMHNISPVKEEHSVLYLCSVEGSGCGLGVCWSGRRLRTARTAPSAPSLTRSAGSVPQTSWWRPGPAGPNAPAPRSSSRQCRYCWRDRGRDIKSLENNATFLWYREYLHNVNFPEATKNSVSFQLCDNVVFFRQSVWFKAI